MEDNTNETMQTDETGTVQTDETGTIQPEETGSRPQDIYEAQGARPRISIVKFDIGYLECFKPIIRQDGCLQISAQDGLVIQGNFQAKVELQDIRLVSKFEHEHGKQCIHVSYYNIEKKCISSIFFEALELDNCFSVLQEFQKQKLVAHSSPEQLDFALNILNTQPIYQGWVKSTIQEKEEGQQAKLEAPPEDAREYLLIVDLECLSWYESKTEVPTYQMTFWADDTPTSVETVRHHHGQNFILFETKKLGIVINAVQEIVKNMRILRPKKVNFLKDIGAFVEFAEQMQLDTPYYQSSPAQSSSVLSYKPSEIWAEKQREDTLEIEVETFVSTLDSAAEQFKSDEYFQNIWITHEYDLMEIVSGGKIPTIDAKSGGLDPDSPEHFKKALTDIDECLSENDYPTCLAKVVAAREIFSVSNIKAVTNFLTSFKDVEILKKLYFRSLVK